VSTRYVSCDDLTRLCAALAYSRTRTLAFADLLHVRLSGFGLNVRSALACELTRYDSKTDEQIDVGVVAAVIKSSAQDADCSGHFGQTETRTRRLASSRGVIMHSGRRSAGCADATDRRRFSVFDHGVGERGLFCAVAFACNEHTWAEYMRTRHSPLSRELSVARHALGTIAIRNSRDADLLFAAATRPEPATARAAHARSGFTSTVRSGKPALAHTEVFAPLIPVPPSSGTGFGFERRPRSHHVRGQLVRRGKSTLLASPASSRKLPRRCVRTQR